MPRYGLIVMGPMGSNALDQVELLETFDASREQAKARLHELMRRWRSPHPMRPQRSRIYRTADGWLMIVDGSSGRAFPYQFRVCELEWDSGDPGYAPEPPTPAPPAEPPQPPEPPQDVGPQDRPPAGP
jgi:hypothetical protein